MTLLQVLGILNVFVGLFLTSSILLFGTGLVVWLSRLGTVSRNLGVQFMEWGVVSLFVLVVMLGIVKLVEKHTTAVAYGIGFIILIIIAGFILNATQGKGKEEKEE
jgi:hypothetical protein